MLPGHLLPLVLALYQLTGGGDPRSCAQLPSVCGDELVNCFSDSGCVAIMGCLLGCEDPLDAECPYTCGMLGLNNQPFLDFMQCTADIDCIPDYPEDGVCLAADEDALQDILDLEQVSGDWWVVKGQNCGQEGWPGGYDWYPCQHERYIRLDGDSWINNTTYCAGSDSACKTPILVTTPTAELTAPGVVRLDYPEGEAPVVPQIEDWRFVSYPDPDWALVIWCGSNPALDYNGAFVISRQRSLDGLADLPEVEAELREAAAAFGMDWDLMCETDNTDCPV